MIATGRPRNRPHEAVPGDHRVGRDEEQPHRPPATTLPVASAVASIAEMTTMYAATAIRSSPGSPLPRDRAEDPPPERRHQRRSRRPPRSTNAHRATARSSRTRRRTRRAPTRNAARPGTKRSCGSIRSTSPASENTSAATNHARHVLRVGRRDRAATAARDQRDERRRLADVLEHARRAARRRSDRDPVPDREHAGERERNRGRRVHGASRSRHSSRRPRARRAR